MATPKKAYRTALKRKAVTAPAKTAKGTLPWWDRPFAVYRPFIVEVVGRRGTVLRFVIISGEEALTDHGKPFAVDLEDGEVVWADLPSTAQLVKPGSAAKFGILFLTPAWAKRAGPAVETDGTGGKIPKTLSI